MNEDTKAVARAIWLIVIAVVLVGLITLVGWQVGWWFKTQDTNRENQLYDNSVGHQNVLKANVTKNIGLVLEITTQINQAKDDPDMAASLTAQRLGVVRMVCSDANGINPAVPLPTDQQQFVADNCTAGAVKPGSTYANH